MHRATSQDLSDLRVRALASLLIAVAAIAGAAALAWSGALGAGAAAARSPAPIAVTVGPAETGARIPAGFLGLSIEYWALEAYAGQDPGAINPLLVQLIRNLLPDQTGVLRIGGVTTDRTWWPVAGAARPPGVTYMLDSSRLAVIRALAEQVGVKLIMGVNFEADSSRLAGAEARAILAAIGRGRISAFELGNEPELYGNPTFGWYQRDGRNVTGRPRSYDEAAFTRDFAQIAAGMPTAPVAGPASGAGEWLADLDQFIPSEPRLRMVTIHRYPYEACDVTPAAPVYPTIGRLLSPAASMGQAKGAMPYVAAAHAHRLALRIDEMNTVSCGTAPGIPNAFAMALWAIDALFADAAVGVDGVNIHTWPGAVYQLFTFQRTASGWQAHVEPEYYGLLMFAQAAPPGSHLLRTSAVTTQIRVWGTRAADGTIRVALLNDDTSAAHRLSVRIPGALGPATTEPLVAPAAGATGGVTLGGQTLDHTATGQLQAPLTTLIPARQGNYSITLPPASAALLTVR